MGDIPQQGGTLQGSLQGKKSRRKINLAPAFLFFGVMGEISISSIPFY
jgi:hypothetical protein